MDKNALKKFAVWARRELISRVSQKALQYGISESDCGEVNVDSVKGRLLTPDEKSQRNSLIEKIKSVGYQEAMEEAAYTWFNRFTALRYMEVNGYLPSHVRVFTDESNNFKPQIIDEAIHLDIKGLDMDKVYAYKEANDTEALYKYLLITQCNAFGEILPGMFSSINDFTILLFPDNILREGSVLEQMISVIPEEDWKDQVQIIGWLYQYYNSEKKDAVFAAMSNKVKVSKENIAAATQLFTPDWIVRYMVENSLGRLWVDGHADTSARSEWKYYLDEAEQTAEVQAQLAEIRAGRKDLTPEQIRFIDPCMGSGHILVYAFDVLMQIYLSCGYTERDAAQNIVRNNLWGLDLDKRAYQLAYFAVMMKARQYDRRFLTRGIKPNLSHFQDLPIVNYSLLDEPIKSFVEQFENADTYGSLITIDAECPYQIEDNEIKNSDDVTSLWLNASQLKHFKRLYDILSQRYDVVCTNPPYMASSNMNSLLNEYIKANYPDSKADFFACFMEKCNVLSKSNGYYSMITQHSWMFIGSYEGLRHKILKNRIISLTHLGIKAFEEIGNDVVQTCAFIMQRNKVDDYKSRFVRLTEYKNYSLKKEQFFNRDNHFISSGDAFSSIPGVPIAYWVSQQFINNFSKGKRIENYGIFTGSQNITGDNDRFLRYFWEVLSNNINSRWRFYAKGGDYRQYYGNLDLVVDWSLSAQNFYKTNKTSNLLNESLWYLEGITYSAVTSRGTGFRYLPNGCIFDKGGPSINVKSNLYEILAFFNSNVAKYYFWVFNPSINLQVKDVKNTPIILDPNERIATLAKECTMLCKTDWDSFETSWDFKKHPFICDCATIQAAYEQWVRVCDERFNKLKTNEEELNRIFIEIYGLQDELTPEVEERDVTVRKADLQRDMRSFVSYAVGCMFGRYSLDTEGLAYAGGEWDESKYKTFSADKDNIIPICDDEYFDDDMTGLFVQFVKTVFGEESLEENLKFIADALGGKGNPRTVIRNYFLKDFYSDHCKTYQKRPIYWLFDSGKKNGFKALIYMHRYQPDTIARIRTGYVHEQQSRYRTAIADVEKRISGAKGSEAVKLNKELDKLNYQADELITYEEKIHHLADQMIKIDLNDGVKKNYEIFKDVLAKIK